MLVNAHAIGVGFCVDLEVYGQSRASSNLMKRQTKVHALNKNQSCSDFARREKMYDYENQTFHIGRNLVAEHLLGCPNQRHVRNKSDVDTAERGIDDFGHRCYGELHFKFTRPVVFFTSFYYFGHYR